MNSRPCKKNRILQLLLFLLLLSSVLVPVFSRGSGAEKFQFKTTDTGIMLPTQRERQWVRLRDAFIQDSSYAAARFLQYSDMDPLLQNEQLNDLHLRGIQLIVLAPVDEIEIGRELNKSRYESLYVIALKKMVLNARNVRHFVGYDYREFGTTIAKSIMNIYDTQRVIFISDRSREGELFLEGLMQKIFFLEPYFLEKTSQGNFNASRIIEIVSPYAGNIIIVSDHVAVLDIVDAYFEEKKVDGSVYYAGVGISSKSVERFKQKKQLIALVESEKDLATRTLEIAEAVLQKKVPSYNAIINNGKTEVNCSFVSPRIIDSSNYRIVEIQK